MIKVTEIAFPPILILTEYGDLYLNRFILYAANTKLGKYIKD